jgi:hypothetical protein
MTKKETRAGAGILLRNHLSEACVFGYDISVPAGLETTDFTDYADKNICHRGSQRNTEVKEK